jgi:ubiquinone/menaquinone biosynthesis C-methylase UbiE
MNSNVFENSIFTKKINSVIRPGGLALTKHLADFCAFPVGGKVIDVGCGTGITVEYLCNKWKLQASGVDPSVMLLQQGKKRSPRLNMIQATGENLPFTSCSVDGVIAECSLSVMQDVGKVLAEISRTLVPQGKLAITDIYIRQPDNVLSLSSDSCVGSICSVMTKGVLKQLLEKNGFKTIIWEDQSACLKEFIACFIMEHGSLEELCHTLPTIKTTKLGYFLLVAEKRS